MQTDGGTPRDEDGTGQGRAAGATALERAVGATVLERAAGATTFERAAGATTLDRSDGALLHAGRRVRLRPKTLAVLVALIERGGAVVGQDELRRLVWGTRFGAEAGPKQCVRELRRLLGDSPAEPWCIETVGRAGYRLLIPIEVVGAAPPPAPHDARTCAPISAPICVGRASELAALAARAASAAHGERGVVILAGEPGAGKTRLTEAFLATREDAQDLWIARGQGVPHPQAREPFGPLIAALAGLAAGRHGPQVRPLLRGVAPSWAAQIPGLGDGRAPPWPVADLANAPAERMLREFSAAMERLTQRIPGVLVLDDLHWADPSTLAWLSAWALRRAPARLLVLGACRPDEAEEGSDLGTTLRMLGRSGGFRLLRLEGLDAGAVRDYLDRRFPGNGFPAGLAAAVAERTEGHAILIDAAVEQWTERGVRRVEGRWMLDRPVAEVVAQIAPGVRSLIADQIDALAPSERRLLEAASVAGARFSAAALAGGRIEREAVERRLEALARRRRFIERAGTARWPDGAAATRYAFRHALHHEALYELIPAANRQGLHRRIGARLEAAYGPKAGEIAPILADHFERAGDWRRAAVHRVRSGAAALDRGAAKEAAAQFRQALALRRDGAEDDGPGAGEPGAGELDALLGLGAALIVCEGFTAAELPAVYRRAHELSRRLVDPGKAIPALAGLWNYHVSRADMATAARLAEDLCRLASGAAAPLRMAAHNAAALTKWFAGAPRACLPHLEAVLALHEAAAPARAAALFGEDPAVVCHHLAACVRQILGERAAAERHFHAGMAAAEALDQPFARAQMLWSGALIAREQGDAGLALERALALVEVCGRSDVPFWLPAGDQMAGWAAVALGDPSGLVRLRAGIEAYVRMKVRSTQPYGLALLAEALARQGEEDAAAGALVAALRATRETGERWYEAELLRLWAELRLRAGRDQAARRALGRAAGLARAQGARLFEERATRRLDTLRGESTVQPDGNVRRSG